MKAIQKIGIIMVVILILAAVSGCVSLFFGDDIEYAMESREYSSEVKKQAAEYVKEKYGDDVKPRSVQVLSNTGPFLSTKKYIIGAIIYFDGFIAITKDGEKFADDRQYDEINAAVIEKYFDDESLGSSFSGDISAGFYEIQISNMTEEEAQRCTSHYYNGDLEAFARAVRICVDANIIYEGYPEKSEEYGELINDKIQEILSKFRSNGLTIGVSDPNKQCHSMPHEVPDAVFTDYTLPRYGDYMKLIAVGDYRYYNGVGYKTTVYQTHFVEIDEYTAVSDDATPIADASEITFQQVDLSDDTTAHPSRYGYGNERDGDKILQLRDTGWSISLSGRDKYNIFLRLDRDHYGIADETIPVIVCKDSVDYHCRYLTVGFRLGQNSPSGDSDWYYLDDEYLYLWIASSQPYISNDWVLAFSDSPIPEEEIKMSQGVIY